MMPDDYISRAEYESRHAEIRATLASLNLKIDALSVKMDSLSSGVDTLKKDKNRVLEATKYLMTFISGTGVVVLGEWIIHIIGR